MTQLIFADESGFESKAPLTLVAAVMVDADKTYLDLKDALSNLREREAPDVPLKENVFHAQTLFSGKAFGEEWKSGQGPPKKGMRILKEICTLFRKYGLTVAFGYCPKLDTFDFSPYMPDENIRLLKDGNLRKKLQTLVAFQLALKQLEGEMKERHPGEIAQLTYERGDGLVNSAIDKMHLLLKYGDSGKFVGPVRSIGDMTTSPKSDASLLVLADVAAFLLRRRLNGKLHIDELIEYAGFPRLAIYSTTSLGKAGGDVFRCV